ncbi:MAG TPA: hypothetical protein VN256_07385 [Pyrinomonadaceae bacterium]|nr:hypothetical protein [Pyrinomonadaceae bacterium]
MEHIFQLLIAVIGGGLVAGFGIFYKFNGRLSQVEAQMEFLKNALTNQMPLIDSRLNRMESQLESINNALSNQYLLMQGIPIPAPTIGKPVGGANAVVDTFKIEPHEIQQEVISQVFELVTDGEALVNLVRSGYVGIKNIKLVTLSQEDNESGTGADYAAIISLENLTDQNVDFVIPKGQVFENQEPQSGRQNLAAARERKETVSARASYDLRVEAHCMNRELSGPDGSPGNITIFKIRNDKFEGQEDLWQSVDDSVHKAKLVVEGRRKKE